ncbi:MAG: nuclear transport factor 2 family protein [Chitinophagaceae bacterium]
MSANKQVIENFYKCFGKKDWQGMTACYHEEVFFYDPVFQDLEAPRARAMWEMLCKQAKDLSVEASNIEADDEGYGSCNWTATYTFSATGRKVVNNCTARFKFEEGKIIEHMDDFDLWKWSRQALGLKGTLLGWSPFVQNAIRKKAKKSLEKFMAQTAGYK